MTGNPIARLATEQDVARIVEICSAGWRDTYAALKTPEYIEQTIAEFYTTERVASDIGAGDLTWGGYVVAELDGRVLVAGGGGLIEPGVGYKQHSSLAVRGQVPGAVQGLPSR